MRVAFFANNRIAPVIARHIRDQGDEIVALILHPPQKRQFGDEIIRESALDKAAIYDGSRLQEPEILTALASHTPDIGVSVLFGYILRRSLLEKLPRGCINLHPALLPYNRGANPNVWSIVDGTPAGATIHYIDEGIDTGDIVGQVEVPVEASDTGESLYRKLETASVELFKKTWSSVRNGNCSRIPQVREHGTVHRLRDLESLDEIHLDRNYSGRDLINILRARTFRPYRGAFFRANGRKIYMRLELECESDPPTPKKI